MWQTNSTFIYIDMIILLVWGFGGQNFDIWKNVIFYVLSGPIGPPSKKILPKNGSKVSVTHMTKKS